MVYALLTRSTFLRASIHPTLRSLTLTRNKSITQAIEAGKRDTSGSSRYPGRTRPSAEESNGNSRMTRAARRREQFGATPSFEKKTRQREEREAQRQGEVGAYKRKDRWNDSDRASTGQRNQSSRFGRVGPARGRNEGMPSRREDGEGEGKGDSSTQGRIMGRQGEEWARPDRPAGERHVERGTPQREFKRRPYAREDDRDSRSDSERRPRTGESNQGGGQESDRRAYSLRSSEGANRDSQRRPYDGRSIEGGERDQGHRPYDSRSTGSADRASERRPYGRASTEDGARGTDRRPSGRTPEVARSFSSGPESLPYTTAASEFIYGHSSVLAAIKANRRKLYKLYVHSQRGGRDGFMAKVRAHKLFEITNEVGDEYLRAMDKASTGRPHNGIVLEASPLPVPPIVALRTPSMEDQSFGVVLDTQSTEDALVNGKNELYSYKSAGWRHPLILYVDGVLDEGNLGAMARSAYFLGVDAIITSTHHVAPWSHVALKASAGAAEAIPIFKVGKPADFLTKSAQTGWKIYASDAVPRAPPSIQSSTTETPEPETSKIVYTLPKSSKRLDSDYCPVAHYPTILMMGAESTGLKYGLSNLAHYNVGIPHGRDVNEVGVDSLNVSVASSLLCYEMLQRPKAKPERKPEDVVF